MHIKKLYIFSGALMILFIFAIWLAPAVPSSMSTKEYFWANKVHTTTQYDLLYLGDSRTYRSLIPSVIDSVLGLESFNFGFNAGSINREIIEAAASKLNSENSRVLVLGITPSSLLEQNGSNPHYNQELNRRNTDLWMRLNVSSMLTRFDPIQPGFLYNTLRNRRIGYFEEFKNDGVVLSERVPSDTAFALSVYTSLFEKESIKSSTIDSLKTFLCTIKAEGIQIIAWRPKGSAAMTLIEDSLSGYRENEIRQLVESCGGIWLETPLPAATYDGSHVPIAVAQEFSRNFAFQLKEVLKSTHP
jgi:hypothetical protein